MPRLNHLIVVLPGFGGSKLEHEEEIVWGRDLLSTLKVLRNPGLLEPDNALVPAGLIDDLCLLPGWALVKGYGDLVRAIEKGFDNTIIDPGRPDARKPHANVVLFPYDFRQGVVAAAERLAQEVRSRLGELSTAEATQRVIVVAHSMGGLVARYWLGPLGGWRCCRALLTVGTPHRGAPKALDALVNGIRVGPVRFGQATEVFRHWTGTHDLLPRYKAVLHAEADTPRYPKDLEEVPGLESTLARRAFSMHKDIEQAWAEIPPPPEGPELIPFFGSAHPTLERAVWDGKELTVTKDRAQWLPDLGLRGDGTVPAVSAVPIELSERRALWRDTPYRHGPMASAAEVVRMLLIVTGAEVAGVRGPGAAPRVRLSLDMEEAYSAGSPINIPVELVPKNQEISQAKVIPYLESHPGKGHRLSTEREGENRWTLKLGVLEPGAYTLEVRARCKPQSPPMVSDSFVVVPR